jgi:hypothetical protein
VCVCVCVCKAEGGRTIAQQLDADEQVRL